MTTYHQDLEDLARFAGAPESAVYEGILWAPSPNRDGRWLLIVGMGGPYVYDYRIGVRVTDRAEALAIARRRSG
jgi:hypothetical protein